MSSRRRSSLDEDHDASQSFEMKTIKHHPGDATFDPQDHGSAARSSSDGSEVSVESFELYTPDEERTVLRKLDWHIVAFMSFLYLLSFLDRSNIGNAKIAGMVEDLDLTDDQFEWLLTGFYITYILFEWMILLYHTLPPRIYISICVFSWGILASLQSMATKFSHMLVLRLLLGISEAAFSPGVPYYLSFFYRREELALRAGMQVSAAPLASSFAGSLAWVITKLAEKSPFAPWRLLFLVEGFPSVLVALIAWRVVPDNLETAWFLTQRERQIAITRLERTRKDASKKMPGIKRDPPSRSKKIDWKEIWTTIRDPKCYLTAIMFLNCNIAFSSMPVFLPSVVKQLGFTSLTSQGLSAPPFLLSFLIVLLTALLSDRMRTRSVFVLFHAALACAAYVLIALGGLFRWPAAVRYLGVYPACAGFFSAVTLIITWTMNNAVSETGRGMGMTILNVLGQCGPLIGTRLYPDADAPGYVRGMMACGAAMGLVALGAGVLRWVLKRENERREREWRREDERFGRGEGDEEEPLAGARDVSASGVDVPGRKDRFVLML